MPGGLRAKGWFRDYRTVRSFRRFHGRDDVGSGLRRLLGPDEVPLIGQTGERVLNRRETAAYDNFIGDMIRLQSSPHGGGNASAAPAVVNNVQIIDQRGTNAPAAEVQQTPNANGGMDYRVIIKAEVQKNFANGGMDGVMAGRYGVKPRVNGR